MLKDLQRAILRALESDDPQAVLREAAAKLSEDDRAALARIDADGLALTRLLVRKLRFERICRGDKQAKAWFDRDPAGFTEAFRAYDREVPHREYFPRQEAESFRAWCGRRGIS